MDEDPDPDQDLRNDYPDFEREEEAMLSAQRPIDTLTSNRFKAPGTRIDDCNMDAKDRASQLRLTVGTVDIATRNGDSADVLQFTYSGSENIYSSRPSCNRESMGGPSSQITSLNTRSGTEGKNSESQEKVWLGGTEKFGSTNYDTKAPSTIAEEQEPMTLGSE